LRLSLVAENADNRGALAVVFDGIAAAVTIVNKDDFENRTVSPSALDDSVFHVGC
jgi:hypothetical protein